MSSNESPRMAAMQRMRAKRAVLKARAADHEQEDQKPNKTRKILMEFQQNQPLHQPLSSTKSQPLLVLAPPRPPPSSPRPPTIITTLQFFPDIDDTTDLNSFDARNHHETNTTYKDNIIGVRRAWVTRVDGKRMNGLLKWSEMANDIIISCECHNLMFSPEGFLNHGGLKGISMDRPLRHIIVSMDHTFSQE